MAQDTFPNIGSRQLRAVVAVAQYRSFIAAATALKMSQPAITRIIKQVEAELGAPLFVRSTRLVSVTELGKEFAALAERLVNDLRIGVAHMRRQVDEPRGQIVVSSVFSPVTAMLPSLVLRASGTARLIMATLQSQTEDPAEARLKLNRSRRAPEQGNREVRCSQTPRAADRTSRRTKSGE